jgi:mannose-6-phosphate isomerase-like protein (cupin superfamily)
MEKINRPWGYYQVLLEDEFCKVKKITIKPGQSPSYQMHYKRNEKWIVVDGKGMSRIDDKFREVCVGDVVDVPINIKHCIENTCNSSDLVFIEIQTGTYFGEDDIVRFEDRYGRA